MAKAMFITKGGEYFPPMGMMQISATAKQRGHEIEVGIISKENVFEKIKEIKPNVVAYAGSTGEHKLYFDFNRELKERYPEIITLMGGPHATFFPEKTLKEANLDAVCVGEGDYVFPDFLDAVDKNEDFSKVMNIITTQNKEKNLRPLVQDLDSLPFADRSIFYNHGESGENPIKHFFVSRGCPYDCTYCFNKSFKSMYPGERYIRKRSVDNIIEEIDTVREKWPLKYIKFFDDVFALKVDDWLEEFAEKYSKKVGIPFFTMMRANNMNEDLANLLKKAGCKALSMSIESANPRLREEVLNRKMSNEQIKYAYKLCGERGIAIQSNNILALPTSKIEDDIATLDFNIECGKKQGTEVIGEFGTAHPYPGTDLWKFCKKNGFYDSENFSNMHMSYHDASPLNCFTPKEKRMQRNLTLLGTVATRFPWTRNLIVNHLIKLPPNSLFFTAFYLTKLTQYMKHVYNLDYTFKDYLRVIPQSLRLDWFKRMGGERWKNEKKHKPVRQISNKK